MAKLYATSPNGTITNLDLSKLLTTENYDNYALPLSGGTMNDSAKIEFQHGSVYSREYGHNSTDGTPSQSIIRQVVMSSNKNMDDWYGSGAKIALHQYDSTEEYTDGKFDLIASDGVNYKQLQGYPSGTLVWGGKTVLVDEGSIKNFNGYLKLSNGIIIQWGAETNLPLGQWTNRTLPIAFPNAALKGFCSVDARNDICGIWINRTTKSEIALMIQTARIDANTQTGTSSTHVSYIVIGY